MLKNLLRKATVPAAAAALILLTGCTGNGQMVAPLTTSPSATSTASAGTPAPDTSAPTASSPAPAPEAPASSAAPAPSSSVVAEAKNAIISIPVKGRAPKTGYDRDQFGPAWADVDRNGCDTRNDILARDLENETFKDGTKQCVVATGVLNDPYTGTVINFVRGQDTSSAVQIDHIFPLSLAWQQGAQQWTAEKRKQFSNDPMNLKAADGPANGSKSDSGPGSWLPPNKAYRCEYVAGFVMVTAKYELSMNQGDYDASKSVLDGCN